MVRINFNVFKIFEYLIIDMFYVEKYLVYEFFNKNSSNNREIIKFVLEYALDITRRIREECTNRKILMQIKLLISNFEINIL
jgi:hypothetical protein